ncbi:MAG: hypothetical protein P4M02_01045, partial [Clostridia bacterium]|nr:hypothetical protein [Clostridia bacterium]
RNQLGQQGLWSMGISGDLPIILLEYYTPADIEKLEPYVRTHKALRLRGIACDLVVVYREGGDYKRMHNNSVLEAVRASGCEYLLESRGGIHVVNLEVNPPEIYYLLMATACHSATSGFLKRPSTEPYARMPLLPVPPALPAPACPQGEVRVFGGNFCGSRFVIPRQGQNPPAPWCSLLANPTFGTLVSDRALGFTWAVNARENKLTPWLNDPVADNRGEMAVIRLGSKLFDLCANARVTFGAGEALYETDLWELSCRLSVRVPPDAMAKIVTLELENKGDRQMEFETAYYIEPVLGVNARTNRQISFKRQEELILLRNPWAPVSGVAFLTADAKFDFISDRASFLTGRWSNTAPTTAPDPCAAVVIRRKLPPKRRERITFVLGWAASEQAACSLEKTLHARKTADRPELPVSQDEIIIKTPDPKLDAVFNHWLRRQFVLARIMGRTGFYQCSGAWGFRDQLQDCCAVLLCDPDIAKRHIYRAAAHQFVEGDVMHWWHQLPLRNGGSRGVRTRCSDDLLWLPYTVCEYLEKTGDDSILSREIYYLEGPELEFTEEDRYFFPPRSGVKEDLYHHCLRAIERAKRFGVHGLPLFGSGDWNDGM